MYSNAKILALMILFYGSVYAEIRMVSSLKDAYSILDALDDKALVVFDVDNTLIMPVDKIHRRHPEAIIGAFQKTYFFDKVTDTARLEYLDSIIWKMLGQKLVDPASPALIKTLQTRNIPVIALTHMHAGAYCAIENMEEWRYNQLCELGIDLAVNNAGTMVFTDLPMGRVSYPVLHKGVFATSRSCTKGQALAAFIKQLKQKPSCIVFFDDLIDHITTMDYEMNLLGIPCIAFHYTATELMQETIDHEVAVFQFQYLIKHGKWLSDIQATELVKSNNERIDTMTEIRPIELHQVNELKQMIAACVFDLLQPYRTVQETEAEFQKNGYFNDVDMMQATYFDGGTFLVLMDGEKIVGAGAIKKYADDSCELKRMWFLKEYRGRGLGSRMAQQLLEFAKNHGYKRVLLDLWFPEVQDRAITLYKKLGFYEIAPYNDSPAKVFMEKVL